MTTLEYKWFKSINPPPNTTTIKLSPKQDATALSQLLREFAFTKQAFALDFSGLEITTQGYLHSLLFNPIRIAWATKTPIYILNEQPNIKVLLKLIEDYTLTKDKPL